MEVQTVLDEDGIAFDLPKLQHSELNALHTFASSSYTHNAPSLDPPTCGRHFDDSANLV